MVAVNGGEEVLPGEGAGLAATGVAADFLAVGTPGVQLLIGQAVPAERSGAKGGRGLLLLGGGALGGGGVLAFALAKSALEGDNFAALPALRDVVYFHRVLVSD